MIRTVRYVDDTYGKTTEFLLVCDGYEDYKKVFRWCDNNIVYHEAEYGYFHISVTVGIEYKIKLMDKIKYLICLEHNGLLETYMLKFP